MGRILGLDLGTNSIGWALIEKSDVDGRILGAGSRIIPMSQDTLGKFDSGQSISQTAERTGYRGIRRLRERHLLRRERLHRVLNILGFLPDHYARQIDFEKRLGQFIPNTEPKLPYIFNTLTNKSDFLFIDSFNEMLQDFTNSQPQLLENNKKIPYDWTIYYLRKKALTKRVEKEELAWLLLNFNQKRGYYQLRGEDEDENPDKLIEFYTLCVNDVTADEPQKGKDEIWYNIILENGWIYRRSSKVTLFDWMGKTKEFIVTTDLNEDKSIKKDKDGKEKRSFKAVDSEKDWIAIKKSTEEKIDKSHKTVGAYIYDTLLQNPNQKIKGKFVRVIERKFYKAELEQILKTQQKFHPQLTDKTLYSACLEELYENNESHRYSNAQKDFANLFLNDIIFYQRPLKSKKSLISNCKFESRTFIKDGKKEIEPIKCIAKSHPLYQEFRLWKLLKDLRIYKKAIPEDIDVTADLLPLDEDRVALFDWLNTRKEIDQQAFLKYSAFNLKKNTDNYRWNYVEDKIYPCNETRAIILSRLNKIENISKDFLTRENEEALWHILYSVEDKNDVEKALKTFAKKKGLGEDFAENFKKAPPFKKEYGSYSAKAIKKLLPIMRLGKYWDAEQVVANMESYKSNIQNLIFTLNSKKERNRAEKEVDRLGNPKLLETFESLLKADIYSFEGLAEYLASYIVYGRHSEDGDIKNWNTADKIQLLPQHSLRNPIVEQVINETLQVVRDIWKKYGNGKADFFNEIHIELGREMKNPKKDREKITKQVTENENTNLRIKALLIELLNDGEIENVRPYSPMQQEILKIYEDGALNAADGNVPNEILKISKQAQPTSSELTRYRLWLEQKYRSPYTGEVIPLSKLFTRAYDIEHIIPQSRYFDDSFSNKVICEAEVNKDKDNSTAYEYIKNNPGKKVELSYGKVVTVFKIDDYEDFIKNNYGKSRSKLKRLLMDDIPESFIQRQLNDSRYISKVVKSLMSNIVREEDEQEAISKNVIATNGAITSTLKQDWGLNDVWNDIVYNRFERLNELTNSTNFGEWTDKEGKKVFQTQIPIQYQKGFNKKRIDHRHHAMDAIVIACASRNHINYLNNESALGKQTKTEKEKKRYDLKQILCYKKYDDSTKQNYKWVFYKPWGTFTQETKEELFNIVVSFKQNLRVINKSVNHYQIAKATGDGSFIKESVKQTKGDSWAVRKSMHTPMPYGKKQYDFDLLKIAENVGKREAIIDAEIKNKVISAFNNCKNKVNETQLFLKNNPILDKEERPVLVAAFKIETEKFRKRQPIAKLSNRGQGGIKTTEEAIKFINKVADHKLNRDLLFHLTENNDDIDKAFSPDGIENFNSKRKIPVYKLPIAENGDKRFPLGERIGSRHKWMEAAEGTNLFFAIYTDDSGKRNYETVPLNIVIERQKQGLLPVPEKNEKGNDLSFYLSPNDLVYVPTQDEIDLSLINFENLDKTQITRIYKFISCTGNEGHFVPNNYASPILKNEMGTNNKSQNTISGIQIKEICLKLKVDRIGNIKFQN